MREHRPTSCSWTTACPGSTASRRPPRSAQPSRTRPSSSSPAARRRASSRRCSRPARSRASRRTRSSTTSSARSSAAADGDARPLMELTAANTAIVLDSTADFPEAPERFPNWRVVPLYVRFGDESFRDYVELGRRRSSTTRLRTADRAADHLAADARRLPRRLRGARRLRARPLAPHLRQALRHDRERALRPRRSASACA